MASITLVWQRLTDKVTCRVKDEREYLCFDIEDKTEVFAFLKDASDRDVCYFPQLYT